MLLTHFIVGSETRRDPKKTIFYKSELIVGLSKDKIGSTSLDIYDFLKINFKLVNQYW